MDTFVFKHGVSGQHEVPAGHVEQQDRYTVVDTALTALSVHDEVVSLHEAPVADDAPILRAHPDAYLTAVTHLAGEIEGDAPIALDPDTFMGPHSFEAARRGAGGAVAAVDAVATGACKNAFVAARPPGHHAEAARAMGFCVFNNAAIAALHARAAHGHQRIAVVDFDVHHGNGTQAILGAAPDAFFASSHEWPQYPGSGPEGDHGANGQCHNAPLPAGTGSSGFRATWEDRLLPALDAFFPDFIVISAGFDAHRADPLGGLELTESDFSWITKAVVEIATDHCAGRVVSVLEGGYDLTALGASAAAHVKTLATGEAAR